MRSSFWGFGIATAAALLMTATVASAKPEPKWDKRAANKPRPAVVKAVSVPEIDAQSGLAAMAALCAALALAWERREKA